jgi:hypothetical protein
MRMMFISLKDYLLAQNHLQEMNQMEYFIYFGVGYHLGGCWTSQKSNIEIKPYF